MCQRDGGSDGAGIAIEAIEKAFEFSTFAAERGGKYVVEPALARMRGEIACRLCEPLLAFAGAFKDAIARLRDQFMRRLLVEHIEGRRHSGFDWKPRKDILTKGVNGLDFYSAGRFERERKKPARFAQTSRIAAFGPDLCKTFRERYVVQHRPFAELAKQARSHLGCGGLGVCEAENALRRRAVEQKSSHAVCERI